MTRLHAARYAFLIALLVLAALTVFFARKKD